MITLLDGPLGTELNARSVATDLPLWSAAAIEQAPGAIAQIHEDYAASGAHVHTANTFRTQRRTVGNQWKRLTAHAVKLARDSAPTSHRVAGSIAPLEDCYSPELSPGKASRDEHREMAQCLAACGCDLLLCETYPIAEEGIVAVEEAVATGVQTWVSFTAGPDANLMTPSELALAGRQAVDAGASAVMVNCTPATKTLEFVQALNDAKLGVPIGAYANAGCPEEKIGWNTSSRGTAVYAQLAQCWIDAGATIVGGCCGTGPSHIAELAKRFEGLLARGGATDASATGD